jgi:hypothetical protein
MDEKARRNLGAHYTSEENILLRLRRNRAVASALRLPLVNTKMIARDARIAANSLGLRRMFWSRLIAIQFSRLAISIHSTSGLSGLNRWWCPAYAIPPSSNAWPSL